MTSQEAFLIADNKVRMQGLEIDKLNRSVEYWKSITNTQLTEDLTEEVSSLREDLLNRDIEIERLKGRIEKLEKLNQMTDEQVVMDLKSEIRDKTSLIKSLASALRDMQDDMTLEQSTHYLPLIAEAEKVLEAEK